MIFENVWSLSRAHKGPHSRGNLDFLVIQFILKYYSAEILYEDSHLHNAWLKRLNTNSLDTELSRLLRFICLAAFFTALVDEAMPPSDQFV